MLHNHTDKSLIEVMLENFLANINSSLQRSTDYIVTFPDCLPSSDYNDANTGHCIFLRFRAGYMAACETDHFIIKHSAMLKKIFSVQLIELIKPEKVFPVFLSTLLEERYNIKFKEILSGETHPRNLLFILENSQDFEKFSLLLKKLDSVYVGNQKNNSTSYFTFFNRQTAICAAPIALAVGACMLYQRSK
jgi:hypothetical protein